MISRDQAIEIARKVVQGTFKPETLAGTEVKSDKGQYIVTFKLTVPPGTLGPNFVQVTLDAQSGQVLKRLLDAE